jgi:MoaA/NifB/PqqE/SkfB family radical SAM enzyme
VTPPVAARVREAIDAEAVSDRVWLYANYHCNLACSYCLTESSPRAPRRELGHDVMVAVASQARALGFRRLGLTGGEVFMRPDIVETIVELARILPLVVLTNGTLFTPRLRERLRPLAGRDVAFQISLDSAEAATNDAARGPGNHRRVVAAIPRLVADGHDVRIATTLGRRDDDALERLCALHRSLGIGDDRHIVRAVVRRGRADEHGAGVAVDHAALHPEPTVTVEGVYWSPFGATVRNGRMDTDLRVSETILPLAEPIGRLLDLADARPGGNDGLIGIR